MDSSTTAIPLLSRSSSDLLMATTSMDSRYNTWTDWTINYTSPTFITDMDQDVTAMESLQDSSGIIQENPGAKAIRIMNSYVVPSTYFILFVFGFIGNSVVVYVSCFLTKTSKNAVDIFVGNLAIADLALVTSLPFWAVTHILGGRWMFKDSGCKIMSFLTHLNMYSSIFLVTAMAVDRYTVVVKAIKVRAKSLRTAKRTLISCAIIWTFSILLSLPAGILRKEKQFSLNSSKIVCSWEYPARTKNIWWATHIVTRNIVGFVIPLAIICRCYCVILNYVRTRSFSTKKNSSGEKADDDQYKNKQQGHVTRLVTVIILAFIVCWLPNQASNFYHSLVHFRALPQPSTINGKEAVYLIHLFSTVLSFCNSVINPVIYSTSPSHRSQIKSLFLRVFKCANRTMTRKGTYSTFLAVRQDPFESIALNSRQLLKPQGQTAEERLGRMSPISRLTPDTQTHGLSADGSTIGPYIFTSQVSRNSANPEYRELEKVEIEVRQTKLPTGVEDSTPQILPDIIIDEYVSDALQVTGVRCEKSNSRDGANVNTYVEIGDNVAAANALLKEEFKSTQC